MAGKIAYKTLNIIYLQGNPAVRIREFLPANLSHRDLVFPKCANEASEREVRWQTGIKIAPPTVHFDASAREVRW